MRRYESRRVEGGNSLLGWHRVRNPLRVVFNYLIMHLVKILPSLSAKRFLLRLTGMKVGKDVAVGLDAQFDIFFPELIEIGENSIIGYHATILAHEFLIREFRTGKVKIGKDVMVGANSTILCGIEIGDGASIAAGAVVDDDVPPGALAGGVPAKVIRG